MQRWEMGATAPVAPISPVQADGRGDLRPAAQTALWLDVLDATIQMSAAHHRGDLQEWLSGRRAQLLHPQLRVLVTGAAGQGKSHLVNALINAPVCPVAGASPAAIATVVRHGDTPTAQLVTRAGPTASWTEPPGPHGRIDLPTERLPDALAEAVLAQPPAAAPLLHAEVGVPRALLASGLVLIDTPALPGLPDDGRDAVADLRGLVTYACADLVLFTCEATREVTTAEVDVLADLARLYPHVLVALTKTDVAPRWRDTLAHTRDRLTAAGVPATVIALSSTLREHAVRSGSHPLNDESGYPHLINHLQHSVSTKQDDFARATVSLIARLVAERIAKPLRADLRHSAEPSDAVAQLHDAQRRLEDLRRITTRWQNCLADETGDLMSDIEHDLRERTRAVLAEAEKTLDTVDPADGWDEFEPWLRQAVQDAAESSFAWLAERGEWLAHRVAEQFPEYADQIVPPWIAGTVDEVPDRSGNLDAPPVERFTTTQKLFTGLRGSYGGILMVGLATSLAGMSLINPISIGGGAIFGGRTIREESKSLLKRRQATAKLAVQRHVDQIFVGLAKDAKDSVRRLQRTLRDHYSGVTEDIHEAIMESLRSAKAEADRELAARAQRARRIEHELDRLAELYTQAVALAPARNPAIAPGSAPA
ncbi:GTP-binding protein [Nucisporomicrobium flavum]|uniref:GTP-binding protein n=1 Tax=Nucisporomicrobium flavum TaxID=2785915 RepID=UPI0018F3EB43|nr:GTP-binding protein [Nucisporomicrobium flavum]